MTICYSAIDNCAAQFNRLDCDGNVLSGPEDVIVSCAAVDVNATPIAGTEQNQTDPNGQGGFCAERNEPASIEGWEIELTLCSKTDVELMEMLGIFDIVTDAEGNCVGWKSKGCADDVCNCDPGEQQCSNPGVAIHLWHTAWCGKERHPDFKFALQAFPSVSFDPTTVQIQRNSEFNTYTLNGRANCNDQYQQGPGSIYPDPEGLDRDHAEWLTNTAPDGICSCDMCGYAPAGTAVGN